MQPDEPLKLNTEALAPIREAAQSALEFPVHASAENADWPRLPDDTFTPEEITAAVGDAGEYEDLNEFNDSNPEDDLNIEADSPPDVSAALDSQHAELQRQALRLQALERRAEDEFPVSTLA